MIDAIVFDFDGTLVQSNHIKYETFFDAAQRHGVAESHTRAVMDELSGADRNRIFREIAVDIAVGPGAIDEKAAAMTDEYTMNCEAAISLCNEVEGTDRALKELAGTGIYLFVNSATPETALARVVEKRGWSEYFTAVLGRPNSKIKNLTQLFSRFPVAPQKTWVVGDGEDDRQSAADAGCPFVQVLSARTGDQNRIHETAERCVSNLDELMALIRDTPLPAK